MLFLFRLRNSIRITVLLYLQTLPPAVAISTREIVCYTACMKAHTKEKIFRIALYHILPSLVLIYFGVGAVLWANQKDMLYHPPEEARFGECPALPDAERLTLSGTRAYFEDRGGEAIAVAYHGNAETACRMTFFAELAKEYGISYLLVEYTGYEGKDVAPSKEAILSNVEDVRAFLAQSEYTKVLLFGRSLGSGPAAYHAMQGGADMVIISGGFDSVGRIAKTYYPLYPVSSLLREDYTPLQWLKSAPSDIEVHLLHARYDAVVPFVRAERLYEEIPQEEKSLTVIESISHSSTHEEAAWREKMQELLSGFSSRE